MDIADRFWSKVDRSAGPDACWPWLGCLDRDGYGRFSIANQARLAHRVAAELNGDEPGPTRDHTCHDPAACPGGPTCPHRRCCNPRHTVDAERGANARRGNHAKPRREKCKQGHPFDEANTQVGRDGRHHCRACHRERQARRAH